MNVNQAKKIHFVGISGIGISGLAKICLAMGKEVTGSDLNESIVTRNLKKSGAVIFIGRHQAKNLPAGADLLIYSNAVPPNNIERKKAAALGLKQMSYPEALGRLTLNKKLICISGMHGKTTTTAMVALILKEAGLDPTYIVGSYLPEIKGNAHLGKSDFMIIEADEFARAMLNYYPDYIILTNLEEDHLDTYKDIEDIKKTFKKYVKNLSRSGILIANNDDKNVREVARVCEAKKVFYSLKRGDYRAINISENQKETIFRVDNADFTLHVPGRHNVYNALAAIALTAGLGIDPKVIKKSLAKFKGTWRRFQLLGQYKNAPVISDYAHHPTEIKALLQAVRTKYPKKRIVLAFQPHQHNRTKNLFKEFTKAFNQADVLIMSEIFEVAGREKKEDRDISAKDLVKEIKLKEKYFVKNLKAAEALIRKKIKKGDVLLIVGAGDVYKLGEKLVKRA